MAHFRKTALVGALGALLAQGAAGSAVVALLPASRLARQVVVYREGVEQARLGAPGARDVILPCAHAAGSTETLQVRVTAQETSPPAESRQADPAQVQQIVAEGRSENVQFVDTLGAELPGGGSLAPVALPDGRTVAVGRAFVTAGNILCLLPATESTARGGPPDPAAPGNRLRLWGTAFRAPNGAAAVLVDGLRPEPAGRRRDEPPWQVTALWAGREVLSATKPGDYELRLPCASRPGAQELAGVRLREFRMADIQVDGHPVAAELAVTTSEMSYGLQGRAGLDADCGMLFCFTEPGRPTFVMKTVSFPLSIAFIRDDGAIVNIVRLSPGDGRYAEPVVPISYVLEMEQGWFQQHGVAPGKTVVIP